MIITELQVKNSLSRPRAHAADGAIGRLDENIGAVAVELTPGDLREIDSAASKITVHGARYPEKLEQMTGR